MPCKYFVITIQEETIRNTIRLMNDDPFMLRMLTESTHFVKTWKTRKLDIRI
jgi:hypothetical protein